MKFEEQWFITTMNGFAESPEAGGLLYLHDCLRKSINTHAFIQIARNDIAATPRTINVRQN